MDVWVYMTCEEEVIYTSACISSLRQTERYVKINGTIP